jgi:hypothetical protein
MLQATEWREKAVQSTGSHVSGQERWTTEEKRSSAVEVEGSSEAAIAGPLGPHIERTELRIESNGKYFFDRP